MDDDDEVVFCDDCGDIFLSSAELIGHTNSVHSKTNQVKNLLEKKYSVMSKSHFDNSYSSHVLFEIKYNQSNIKSLFLLKSLNKSPID